jgi:hypothetical protein
MTLVMQNRKSPTNFVGGKLCEGRLSSTVLWEGRGEIPQPDSIMPNITKKVKIN